ncbi:MAG: hypothetical protein ABIT47_02435 [Candidatus Paceibacterota bacterium]
MKKAVGIIVFFLFFLLLLGAVLFKVFAPSKSNNTAVTPVQFPTASAPVGVAEEDPAQFVQSFYTWYLQNYSRDHDFPHSENRDEVLSPWLASDLLANWDQIVLDNDVNPVLLTADDPSVWGNEISARLASQSIRTSIVYVTMGSGTTLHAYNVSLVKASDGTWKITGVASTI